MSKQRGRFLAIFALILCCPAIGKAQFNTIRKKEKVEYEIIPLTKIESDSVVIQQFEIIDSIPTYLDSIESSYNHIESRRESVCAVRKNQPDYNKHYEGLPGLTINNLLWEIRKNHIQHEKIVLAQAILETGWFTSSVCRNKNNLFGLTNPRTGKYYEFDHWTESVKAYYDKVQYRYKGGNYLLWLDKIGYAEANTYIQSLIRILRQYLM